MVPNPSPANECGPPCTHSTWLNSKFFTGDVGIGWTPTEPGFITLNVPGLGAFPVFPQSLLKRPGGGVVCIKAAGPA